jgi:HK97 family phage portal protein
VSTSAKRKKTPATKSKARKPVRRKNLAPSADKSDPARNPSGIIVLPQRTGGVRVTEETALTLGAFWACVRVITETLAGLPWGVCRGRGDGGIDRLQGNPINWLLNVQANPEVPAFQFRETILGHALTWGNGYAEIERDPLGRPVWLWGIAPDRVLPSREQGRIVYKVKNPNGTDTILEPDDMFHLRGLGFDGLVGYSIVRLFARSIGTGIALEESVATLFANDATPGGILRHPSRLSPEASSKLRESWQRRHAGPYNRRTVAVLEEGLDWKQIGLPPEDLQLLEQRQFTPVEICRICRVPPHKIADLTRATFSNIEHQSIEFVNDTLRPWAERLETEANVKLFGRTNRGTLETEIDLRELKRGDMNAQMQFVNQMMGWGIFSVNDGREYLGLNGIGKDGDKRFVPMNYQLLEAAGAQPPPPAGKPAPADGDEDEPEVSDGDLAARIEARCMPVLTCACARVLKRESDRWAKSKPQGYDTWIEKELPAQRAYADDQIIPAARLLGELLAPECPQVADVAVRNVLDYRFDQLRRELSVLHDPESVARDIRDTIKALIAGV